MLSALKEMPEQLSEEQMNQPDETLLRVLDQFVFRFTKLQDTMGNQVLRQFAVQVLFEPVEDAAFVDILRLLERHGFLSAQAWALQRSVRNALAHEYPEDQLRLVLALNDARAKALQLSEWLFAMKSKAFPS
jgi:hypothetical protein